MYIAPDKGRMKSFLGSSCGKHETFNQDLGCGAKNSPSVQMLQCHKLCTSSVHFKLTDTYTDLAYYNRDSAHCEFLSSSLIFKLLAHSFLCTT